MKEKNILWLIAFALLMPLFALTACSDDDDDDNDSNGDKTEQTINDGTKVLSKKVTKIVETSDNKDYEHIWYFDKDGRLTESKDIDGSYTETATYIYSKDKIEVIEVDDYDTDTWTIYLENGRAVECRDGSLTGKFAYSSDGYLESYSLVYDDGNHKYTAEIKSTIENGNFTKIEELYISNEYRNVESTSISYSSKLNNLNVDLTQILLEFDDLGPCVGKRSKNLPSTYSWIITETYTDNGETTEGTYSEVENFEYIYEGDYPVKILVDVVERGRERSHTYEFFYE